MARIRDPRRFSEHFGVPTERMDELGVLDPTLNVDTRLFIDPLLLEDSRHPEIADGARSTYEQHFTTIIKFLRKSTSREDVAWRTAERLLSFPEIKWTCLGYGAGSVSGSGSGTVGRNGVTVMRSGSPGRCAGGSPPAWHRGCACCVADPPA